MSPAPDDGYFSVLLGRVAVHQDLLWFAVLVGWSLAFALWWRHPMRQTLGRLLPWIAAARGLGAMVQFLAYNPPFDLFLERLAPGTNSTYLPALLDPNLTADLILAALTYAVFFVWWEQSAGTRGTRLLRRWYGGVMLAGLVVIHWVWPQVSCWLLAILPLAPAWQLLRDPTARGFSLTAFLTPALVPALSTVGPVAYYVGMMQRTAPSTPMGVIASAFQLVLSMMLVAHLARVRPVSAAVSRAEVRRMARPFLIAAAVLLAVGLGFALKTGQDNRWEVLNGRLRTTVYHASLLRPEEFAVFTSDAFRPISPRAADAGGTAIAPGLAPDIARASRALRERILATQFQESAHFLVVHDGWLVEAASTVPRRQPGEIRVRRRAGKDELAAWANPEPHLQLSRVPEQGAPYYCRAPLLDGEGRMLGWFEYPREEFYSSMARKWRTGPLLVTALGLVLTAALYFQKRANLEQERALRAAAVEAEANRLKTTFLAKVSHELRTPIQSLLGYGHLLQTRLGDDPKARAWLAALQQHGEIMTRLVNDLLDLSAAQSGSFRLVPRAVDPGRLVCGIAASLEPRAAARGLRLHCTIAPSVPAWVRADGDRLGQIVINLTGNAIKFTDAGEVQVTLDARSDAKGAMWLVLAVRDTGPGIAPEEQAGLFAPFARLERTAGREGTGLGLALCAALCHAMDGHLQVESDGVHGSIFRAEIRVAPCAAPAENVDDENAAAFRPSVLVVDDNTLVRELFVAYFRDRGCECDGAPTAAEALTMATRRPPAAIVLDLSLPDGDGISLMPALRSLVPAARIIGVSAHASGVEREESIAAGMTEFFTKPVALDALWAAVAAGPAEPAPAFHVPPELQALFRRELPALRAELTAAVQEGDFPRVARRAHYLRNSALVVNAQDLLGACTDLEKSAGLGGREQVIAAWARCDVLIARALDTPREVDE